MIKFCCFVNREQYGSRDVWAYLERNWVFFFWLTGEIPPTLQLVVDGIQHEFNPNVNRGRPQILDFRN